MQHSSNDSQKACYAGFFPRLLAYGIDCFLFYLLWALCIGSPDVLDETCIFFHYTWNDVLYYASRALLFSAFLSRTGATPGKHCMRIRVVGMDGSELSFGKALYRESVGRYLTTYIRYIGYLFIFFHAKKQSLHDILSDTIVVKRDADLSVLYPDTPSEDIPEPIVFCTDETDTSVPFTPHVESDEDTASDTASTESEDIASAVPDTEETTATED